uniref:Uncharacterized protein n=1 Tax=Knipowitschia caucasica TaxID=637954 RepID=A0AAV2K3I7_KNICA
MEEEEEELEEEEVMEEEEEELEEEEVMEEEEEEEVMEEEEERRVIFSRAVPMAASPLLPAHLRDRMYSRREPEHLAALCGVQAAKCLQTQVE